MTSTRDVVSEANRIGWKVVARIAGDDALRDLESPHALTGETGRQWHPLSVDQGDLGLAFLYATADCADPEGGWDTRAHSHLLAVASSFAAATSTGPGLFGAGAVSIAFQVLGRGGTRYRRAHEAADQSVRGQLRSLLERVPLQGGLPTRDYDLASGVAGALASMIITGCSKTDPLAKEATKTLASWALRRAPQGYWTPGAHVTEFDRLNRPECVDGYLDLGLAHGVAGVLATLGAAHRMGIEADAAREAGVRLRNELGDNLSRTSHGVDVAYRRTASVVSRSDAARTAWCYGVPGLALAFASSAVEEGDRAVAEELWASTMARPRASRGLSGSGICHGSAGLVLVGRALRRSGVPVPEEDLVSLVTEIIDASQESSRYGFRDLDNRGVEYDTAGFLQGAAGVAATLLSVGSPVPTAAEKIFTGVIDARP